MSKLPNIQHVVLAMGLLGLFATPPFALAAGDLSALRQEALDLTNAARTEEGLAELEPSEILDQVAQDHATDMLERGFYDHVTPEGETPFDRFIAAGGSNWALSGENIATCEGCPTPPDEGRVRAFHEGWMQSPGHRENILSKGFDSFGFGIVAHDDAVYSVQTFSGPGAEGSAQALAPDVARELALDEINAARAAAGFEQLEPSEALDTVAERVLENLADDPQSLPDDVFGLLPEGSTGWTSLALQTASLGGSGASLTQDSVMQIISDWSSGAVADQPIGGATASHFGFAAEAAGDGRTTAVAVSGGRQ